MVELSLEQKRAIARAKARQAASAPAPHQDPARTGAMQGMTFGFADEILAGAMTPIEMGIDAVQGKPFDPGRSFNQALERNRGSDAAAEAENPALFTAGNIAGGVGVGMGAANAGLTLMKGAAPTVGSMATRGAAEGAIYGGLHGLGSGTDDKVGDALKGAATGAALGGALGGVFGGAASKSAQTAAGTVDDLKGQAGALYETARQSGVVAPQATTQSLAQQMRQIATNEGIISPTGRVNSTYPEIAEVLRTVDDYALGTMTVPQMQSVRQVLTDAAKSQKPGERRIAVLMLEQLDNVTSKLAPELQQANALYHRAMNADLLEEAILVARQKSGQYGRSLDATLREQFGALERQIIKGELRGFSEAERAAISKVAQGGPIEGILTIIGKAAPSGIVSAAGGFGVPFAVGNAVGGPAVGTAAGLGTLAAGIAARQGASAMTNSSARQAVLQALLGAGARPQANAAISPVAQALIAGGGTAAPEINPAVVRALAFN